MLTSFGRRKHYQTCLCKRHALLWRKSSPAETCLQTPNVDAPTFPLRHRRPARSPLTPSTSRGVTRAPSPRAFPAPMENRPAPTCSPVPWQSNSAGPSLGSSSQRRIHDRNGSDGEAPRSRLDLSCELCPAFRQKGERSGMARR